MKAGLQRFSRWLGQWVADVLLGMLLLSGPSFAALPPVSVEHWRVSQVQVNEWRSDRLLYQIDDPRLVGRVIDFLPKRIDSDLPDATACAEPTQQRSRLRLNALLEQSMQPIRPELDMAQSFGLSVSGQTDVDVRWLACRPGTWGPAPLRTPVQGSAGDLQGNWLALLPDGSALLRWYGDTLLVLKPSLPGEKIPPSFSCAKARWPAERAICGNARLASYDRSLTQAWRVATQACDQEAQCLSELKRSQRQWVLRRNQCQRDLVCLRQAMQERLNALMTFPE